VQPSVLRTRAYSRRAGSTFVLLTLVLAALLSQLALALESIVLVGSGSSVPLPLFRKWTSEYNKRNPAIQMQYLPLGTSEGIKQISHGVGDFGAGEVPLTTKERGEGNLIELPVVLIGIVPIYNLPGVTRDLKFSGDLLAEIFLGHVKSWNAPQIVRLNPGVTLPNLPIKVVYRPGGKGSNYVFTDFLSKTSSRFREEIGVSPSPKWPAGAPAERSSDMADKVRGETGSIGYVELQYAVAEKIPYGLILNPAGKFVKASSTTITAACRAAETPQWDKFSASLTNAPGADSFPISSFSWIYVRTSSSDPRRKDALVDLLNWFFSNGQQFSAQEGYSPLPRELLVKIKTQISSIH
jgi:phosphate transport system substrate-binding protein